MTRTAKEIAFWSNSQSPWATIFGRYPWEDRSETKILPQVGPVTVHDSTSINSWLHNVCCKIQFWHTQQQTKVSKVEKNKYNWLTGKFHYQVFSLGQNHLKNEPSSIIMGECYGFDISWALHRQTLPHERSQHHISWPPNIWMGKRAWCRTHRIQILVSAPRWE